MATFELKSQLPKADQDELDRISALSAAARTTQEANFLAAYLRYVTNRVMRYDVVVGPTAQNPSPQTSTQYIVEAEGNSLPTSYEGFKKGAFFWKLNRDGANLFINVGKIGRAHV